MKEGRDFSIIFHINSHYNDLKDDVVTLDSFKAFVESKEKRRAILFDFLQIGELTHQLSKRFISAFDDGGTDKLVAIRNRIVHGYSTVRDDLIFATLKNDLPGYIARLNQFARLFYLDMLKSFLKKKIRVYIDSELIGNQEKSAVEKIYTGYFEGMTTLDGEFQCVYLVGNNKLSKECECSAIAIINQTNEEKDILIVSDEQKNYSVNEIEDFARSICEKAHPYTIIV